ncbi:MAG: transposase [Patescibacteria group bacterium]|nr:transposase [Patescibacteria group bacterium]
MATRPKMAVGEWYHCYTRGVDKRTVFETSDDFERFLAHLYVGNGTRNIRVSDQLNTRLQAVLANKNLERGEKLVEIGAYALMPNHAHFIIREIRERGIAHFMQKIFTVYTKYFNNKYGRTGAFASTFKSRHISDDRYLKQVVPYVLLNPAKLFEPKWKTGQISPDAIEKKLLAYPYSSLLDFFGVDRPHNAIIDNSLNTYYDEIPSLSSMLRTAQEYYQEYNPQV